MRCELAGYSGPSGPQLLYLQDGVPFVKAGFEAAGYTNYDVMCIGGAGGRGTYAYTASGGVFVKVYSAAGGGGGLHRVQGLLSALPNSLAVVVGLAAEDRPLVTDLVDSSEYLAGLPGGYSSFGEVCKASGGLGGEAYSTAPGHGYGGAGGIGGSITAGGGGAGGTPTPYPAPNDGLQGSPGGWDGTIGAGGGGGARGGAAWGTSGSLLLNATRGGMGSYSVSDTSVFGPQGMSKDDPAVPEGDENYIIPGPGGGAKTTPVTATTTVYGSKADDCLPDGIVVIRLTTV